MNAKPSWPPRDVAPFNIVTLSEGGVRNTYSACLCRRFLKTFEHWKTCLLLKPRNMPIAENEAFKICGTACSTLLGFFTPEDSWREISPCGNNAPASTRNPKWKWNENSMKKSLLSWCVHSSACLILEISLKAIKLQNGGLVKLEALLKFLLNRKNGRLVTPCAHVWPLALSFYQDWKSKFLRLHFRSLVGQKFQLVASFLCVPRFLRSLANGSSLLESAGNCSRWLIEWSSQISKASGVSFKSEGIFSSSPFPWFEPWNLPTHRFQNAFILYY